MLLYTMLYIVLAYLMLFAALTNSVCLNNASFFFLFKYFLCQGYELSGEIALKNNHYYYYYYYFTAESTEANSTRAFLARNIPRCCRKVKQMAYTTYIRPTVEYASPVWDPHTKRNTNKIEMVQRRCARYVTGNFDRTSSVTSMLNCLSWQHWKKDGANTALL